VRVLRLMIDPLTEERTPSDFTEPRPSRELPRHAPLRPDHLSEDQSADATFSPWCPSSATSQHKRRRMQ
jgi:hypothetical protein